MYKFDRKTLRHMQYILNNGATSAVILRFGVVYPQYSSIRPKKEDALNEYVMNSQAMFRIELCCRGN